MKEGIFTHVGHLNHMCPVRVRHILAKECDAELQKALGEMSAEDQEQCCNTTICILWKIFSPESIQQIS